MAKDAAFRLLRCYLLLLTSLPLIFGCDTDMDCLLNGKCQQDQTCSCYAPWAGDSCGQMSFKPIPPIQGYGMDPNLTSWGGNIMYVDGKYHLYVAEMVLNCSLNYWGQNSQVSHAVSDTIQGPYKFSDVALPVWAHNPQVVPYMENGTMTFALFHIGDANGGNPANCTTSMPEDDMNTIDLDYFQKGGRIRSRRPADAGSTLHTSASPYGPWMPMTQQPPDGCNNPAPMIHPNGTWFIICNEVQLYSAPALAGPWTSIATINITNGVPDGTYEDAFLYIDLRGNWHVLFHVYNITTPCGDCPGTMVGGHSYSPDGIDWYSTQEQPFYNTYEKTDGTTVTLATRERPKLFFDSTGQETHLVSAVCGGTATCPPTPAVNCKNNAWDFTLVAPLDV